LQSSARLTTTPCHERLAEDSSPYLRQPLFPNTLPRRIYHSLSHGIVRPVDYWLFAAVSGRKSREAELMQ